MKALVGSWDNRPYRLLAEVTSLRTRVRELEAELAAVRAENARLHASREAEVASVDVDDLEVALPRA